jgi:predicted nucleotidyltransferase
MKSSDIYIKLKALLPELKTRYPIAELALFGSQTRDDAEADSDVDLLVSFNGPIGIEFVDLADELEHALEKNVDLITKEGLKTRQWEYLKNRLLYL